MRGSGSDGKVVSGIKVRKTPTWAEGRPTSGEAARAQRARFHE